MDECVAHPMDPAALLVRHCLPRPCMDGSCRARALLGSGVWSVAAMYTASWMRHEFAARPDECSRLSGSQSMARALKGAPVRTGCPGQFHRQFAITSLCACRLEQATYAARCSNLHAARVYAGRAR